MDKDCRPVLWEHYVWLPRKFIDMEPKAKSSPVQERTHSQFGTRILGANPAHHPTSLGSGKHIGHSLILTF